MKKFIGIILCIIILISDSTNFYSAEMSDYLYKTLEVEYSDSLGSIDTLEIMTKDGNVYANAESLGKRLGYKVNISDKYVSIYNDEESENVPYGITTFYYGETTIKHMLFNKMIDYEGAFDTIKNEKGVWIPLEQSLLILNCSMLIVDNKVLIEVPHKNTVDIFMDVMKKNNNYLFEWGKDFGYTESDWQIIGKASHMVNILNGLLELDGMSWVQFVQLFAMRSDAYDEKYGEALARLFCTYSDDEFNREIKNVKNAMGHFDGSGTFGKTLEALEKSTPDDDEIGKLQETCQTFKDNLDGTNDSVVKYNQSYQELEKAVNEATMFENTAGKIIDIQKGVANAVGIVNKVSAIVETINYMEEFKNQDDYTVNALLYFTSNTNSSSKMSNTMKSSINSYGNSLKTDILTYSAMEYLKNNYDNLTMQAMNLSEVLGSEASLELIAWNLAKSVNILNIGDKIDAADQFELATYGTVFQADAFSCYQRQRNDLFNESDKITAENLYSISQLCYIYLKSCYITREAAIASLKGKTSETQEKIKPLIEYQNSINDEIAGYLIDLKNADESNENLCYGFLPVNNQEYLENYNADNLKKAISSMDYKQAYKDFISEYEEAASISEEEWFNNQDEYRNKYGNLNFDLLNEYHKGEHYDEMLDGDVQEVLLYAEYDIDGNGIPELIIALGVTEISICDIYSFDGEKVVNVFGNSNFENRYSINTNNVIEQYRADGYSLYRLSGTSYEELQENEENRNRSAYQWIWSENDWTIFAEDVPAEVENLNLAEDFIYEKLVEYYSKGTEDDSGEDMIVMEGDMYEADDGNMHYFTMIRCGVPGNDEVTQVLYEVDVNAANGRVRQTRVLTDNKLTIFNIMD